MDTTALSECIQLKQEMSRALEPEINTSQYLSDQNGVRYQNNRSNRRNKMRPLYGYKEVETRVNPFDPASSKAKATNREAPH